ncbi:hypothetical protein BDV96DRAFT_51474 [Lophiotrema nucula]|uniref:Uncharacterized protein n=1 Tax=Lophiotrema nucula TaxID=690887 RepID=A0A6A5ZD74_9PLEO|nr:hypothetical protein BDV96DRAFT_51474 [Lophiotrema nucula]
MSSRRPPKSAPRKQLYDYLPGLTDAHYNELLKDANEARDRLSWNPANLTQVSSRDRVLGPYKWDQISATAKHNEMLAMAKTTNPVTIRYYYMGRYSTTVVEENWVAEWFLWHSFRYRDNRPDNNQGNGGK